MSEVLGISSLRDTRLWKRLNTGFAKTKSAAVAKTLATNLPSICAEASTRMKACPRFFAEFTLHDETHLLRVTELMAFILGDALNTLNPVELTLLILAAHFHDIGMVIDDSELQALEKNADFQLFRSNWEVEHPNVGDIKRQLRDDTLEEDHRNRCMQADEELRAALLSDYLRTTHGSRSADFVSGQYAADKRWESAAAMLTPLVALLCASHTLSSDRIGPSAGLNYDEQVGTTSVNLAYLATVLRLSDILDLDRERTPDALYRTIHFTNKVSVQEWAKHRQVDGWLVNKQMIRFTMHCDHPIYERVAREFMDNIDDELSNARQVVDNQPWSFRKYVLELPLKVDRSRIGPKDGTYIYHDLEFSMSRDEVVGLLMGSELYSSSSLCVRELLQNALDALRHRKAVVRRDIGSDWLDGIVRLEHGIDKHGREFVTCADNGIGMSEDIIIRFLTKAGRSYYRSPEFERERVSFREAGVDFDPCARFGIGFMSCFMLGDDITIHTRRDRGPLLGQGEPLVVQVSGLGGLVVIRPGDVSQPLGTTVRVVCREREPFHSEWSDKIRLVLTVDGYALATEFPIEARCHVPGIEDDVLVPATIAVRGTALENAGLEKIVTLEQDYREIALGLNGLKRMSFLADEFGRPTIKNSEGSWRPGEEGAHGAELWVGEPRHQLHGNAGGALCIDGILVAGEPGRQKDCGFLGHRGNPLDRNDPVAYLLDVRGGLKPPLTPARTPPENLHWSEPGEWRRLRRLDELAQGRLWEKVAEALPGENYAETLWQLALAYRAGIPYMRMGSIWSSIAAPVCGLDGEVLWKRLSSLGPIEMESAGWPKLTDLNGATIGVHPGLCQWSSRRRDDSLEKPIDQIVSSVLAMCTVVGADGRITLELREPNEPNVAGQEHVIQDRFDWRRLLPYEGTLRGVVSAALPFQTANLAHPLSQLALGAQFNEHPSDIERLATRVVWLQPNDLLTESDVVERFSEWYRNLGHLYRAVNWSAVSEQLRPPYKFWAGDIGEVELTGSILSDWADGRTTPLHAG
jgi:hypothetical protein